MRSLLLALILSTTTFGCTKTDTESATTAELASKPTTDKAAPPAGYDNRAADDKATEDLQARGVVAAEANAAKAESDSEAVSAHEVTQGQLQASFDVSSRRLNRLEETVATMTGTRKQQAAAAVVVAKTQESKVMASIAKLRNATLPRWDTAKAQLDADAVAFTNSIDAVEATTK